MAEAVGRELEALLAMVFDMPVAGIAPGMRLRELDNWSSLTFIVLHVGIEKRFGIAIEPGEVLAAETVGGLGAVIAARRGDAG